MANIMIENREQAVSVSLPAIYPCLRNSLERTLTFGCVRPVKIETCTQEQLIVTCKPEDVGQVMLIVEAFRDGAKAIEEVRE